MNDAALHADRHHGFGGSGKGRLLVAASWFPPSVSGSSILTRNLWEEWPDDDFVVLSHRPPGARTDPSLTLPGVSHRLIEPWPLKSERAAMHLDPLVAGVVRRAILEQAVRTPLRAIWVNWPTTAFLLGSWQASRQLRLPLYIHLHDMWTESFLKTRQVVERVAGRFYEARVLKSARRLFTITSEAREHFRKKHGLDSCVLDHSIPERDLTGANEQAPTVEKGLIHLTGSIYPLMNEDAMVNVARAIPRCESRTVLECYTPTSPSYLEAAGIHGPQIHVRFAPKAEVMNAQRKAEILILPLAFNSPNPLEIRTVFPTRLLEYLVSRRPILVHGPSDSWASRNARDLGWGEVVDVPDPAAVAAAIDRLRADAGRQASLVAAASAEATRRAAPAVASRLRMELARLEEGIPAAEPLPN